MKQLDKNKILSEYMFYMESTHGFPREMFMELLEGDTVLPIFFSAWNWYRKKYKIPNGEKLSFDEFMNKLKDNGIKDSHIKNFEDRYKNGCNNLLSKK